ncbi:hypothetical protein KUTeg_021952 [Tegillarca granosa]|uniref:Uncharacterized protein n=1 Tax=Tegillarca granosa TaxID=220873 RepID=A0ABQ9EB02_TEGGR|nr:hypothetical protein KUTeg_021952 [Tegillarca granosa]
MSTPRDVCQKCEILRRRIQDAASDEDKLLNISLVDETKSLQLDKSSKIRGSKMKMLRRRDCFLTYKQRFEYDVRMKGQKMKKF